MGTKLRRDVIPPPPPPEPPPQPPPPQPLPPRPIRPGYVDPRDPLGFGEYVTHCTDTYQIVDNVEVFVSRTCIKVPKGSTP